MKIEKKTVQIIIDSKKCDACTKLAGNYYEAVMHIRGEAKGEIFNAVENSMVLSHYKLVRNGYDIRIVRKRDAARLLNLLKHYSIKRSFKLVGQKGGKKIYRVYYSIR